MGLQIWRIAEPVLADAGIGFCAPYSPYCGTARAVLESRLALHPNYEGRTIVNESIPE